MPNMPEVAAPHIDQEKIERAKRKVNELSDFVEGQAVAMAEYLEEQTVAIQEKSVESLRQARRGLDKLVVEARKMVHDHEDDQAEAQTFRMKKQRKWMDKRRKLMDVWSGSGQIGRKRSGRKHFRKCTGNKDEKKEKEAQRGGRRWLRAEKQSRGRRMLDMIHHVRTSRPSLDPTVTVADTRQGAMAFVL